MTINQYQTDRSDRHAENIRCMSLEGLQLGSSAGIPELDVAHGIAGDYCPVHESTNGPDKSSLSSCSVRGHPICHTTSLDVPLPERAVRSARHEPFVGPLEIVVITIIVARRCF
jgi:hypothetical protein